jgi:hypothetical protein
MSLKDFKLLTLESETEVNANWPLANLRPGFVGTIDDAIDKTMSSTGESHVDP